MRSSSVLLLLQFVFIFTKTGETYVLVTTLDRYRNIFLLVRQVTLNYTLANIDSIYGENVRQGKTQNRIPDSQNFPCDVRGTKSPVVPTSVNQVRPGDIDVIASMGDSLSAGNGAMSTTVPHIINEFRSIAFSGGGRATWRKYLTLPNILKEFNPNLYGYAISDGPTRNRKSRLNIAEPMLMSRDLPFQVRTLIKRMNIDPNIDVKNHWKLLTIFVGNNDVCSDMCHHKHMEEFLTAHENDLLKGLRMLRDNVPRLIVNILPVPHMKLLYDMKGTSSQCKIVHKVGCHCIFKAGPKNHLKKFYEVITEWQRRDEQIANRKEFQTQDFSVIFQPFLINVTIPLLEDGNTDLRMFASDCFHFSQIGHALAANALWNNMMQPEQLKQREMYPLFEPFECPSKERPFIATRENSRNALSSKLVK